MLKDVHKAYMERFQKFVYYITALCVSAIAFTAYTTMDRHFQCYDVILGISVLCWMISIFSGLRIMGLILDHDGLTVQLLTGVYTPQAVAEKKKELTEWIIHYIKVQRWCFYIGIALYVIWHVVKMSYN